MEKKALVVDDDPYVGKIVLRLLRKYLGFLASYIDNPVRALEYLKSCGSLDLLVSDYKMPEMNGLEFVKKAREFNPEIRQIIIVSGTPDKNLLREAIKEGIKFLPKPFRLAELKKTIKE